MTENAKKLSRDLATLALAKAIAEGDAKGVELSLNSGGDPDAYWIDGRTKLWALAKQRGPASLSKAMERLLAPQRLKKIPSMKDDQVCGRKSSSCLSRSAVLTSTVKQNHWQGLDEATFDP